MGVRNVSDVLRHTYASRELHMYMNMFLYSHGRLVPEPHRCQKNLWMLISNIKWCHIACSKNTSSPTV